MQHLANSYKDLTFLFPDDVHENSPPSPFMVFCNSQVKAEEVAKYLRRRLAKKRLEDKVVWFHASMSDEFKMATIYKLE